jgi:hypothetical protein
MEMNILWKQHQTKGRSSLEGRSIDLSGYLALQCEKAPELSYGTV